MSQTYDGWRLLNPAPRLVPFVYSTGAVGGKASLAGVSANRCLVTQITGVNPSGTARYFQLFEKSPVANDLPALSIYVAVNGNFAWVPSQNGRVFDALYFAVSSTADVYTATAEQFVVFVEGATTA